MLHGTGDPGLGGGEVVSSNRRLFTLLLGVVLPIGFGLAPASASSGSGSLDQGVGNIPQGTQHDSAYVQSLAANHVTNVFVTSQQVSCYVPEVPYTGNVPCPGATTGEDLGPYPTQAGSNFPYATGGPKQATDHSESDIRVDPTNPKHLIGSTKWFTSAPGYNHLLGFYESWDGGKTWPTMGHVPGYEGFTDNTDPEGAFDAFGNYYQALLPYQFYYDKSGSHKFEVGNEPNPNIPNEAVAVAVRPHGATGVNDWTTARTAAHPNGQTDYVFTTNAGFGQEPDKEWIAIDRNHFLPNGSLNPNYNRIYMMYVNFDGHGSKPYVQTAVAMKNGTHTAWSPQLQLPTPQASNNNTYLLPHIDPNGVVYTPLINYDSSQGSCCVNVLVDWSTDGGQTWNGPSRVASGVVVPPLSGPGYANTTFEDGIEETFAVGNHLDSLGHYPVYVGYESKSSGNGNILLSASYDGAATWVPAIQVNDNEHPVDEFQPNLAVASDGTVSVNFYDRRLACPVKGPEATAAGLALDTTNPNYDPTKLPPYGASNYCINASVQFYTPSLTPIGHNIRLTQHAWDPQLNAPQNHCACNPDDTFIGDYFGNEFNGAVDYSSFVSTYNDGTNSQHYQQQLFATVTIPAH
jgi:hypothetical protein